MARRLQGSSKAASTATTTPKATKASKATKNAKTAKSTKAAKSPKAPKAKASTGVGKRILRGIRNIIKMILVPIVVILLVIQTIRVGILKKEVAQKSQNVANFQTAAQFDQQQNNQKVTDAEKKNENLQAEINQLYADIDTLNTQLDELNAQLDQKDQEIGNLNSELIVAQGQAEQFSDLEDTSYLASKFPFDGNYYYDVNDVVFYTDQTCTQPIKGTIRFRSKEQDYITATNGLGVHCLRTDTGTIVYYSQGNVDLWKEVDYLKEFY